MKEGCNPDKCPRNCKKKINKETREKLLKSFWHLGSTKLCWAYISKSVKDVPIKSIRPEAERHKKHSRKYFFKQSGEDLIVCKRFFLDTLDISQSLVDTAINKTDEHEIVQRSEKEDHGNRLASDTDAIKEHIKSFPIVESHYTRQSS